MFVHSLVKVDHQDRHGWRAPIELGDAAPHYISFVIPLDRNYDVEDEYTCEIAGTTSRERNQEVWKLTKAGTDSFVLESSHEAKLWFHIREVRKSERRLPYVGHLRHGDFENLFMEIVPDRVAEMDQLCDEQGIFIIGCDPEKHYSGLIPVEGIESSER